MGNIVHGAPDFSFAYTVKFQVHSQHLESERKYRGVVIALVDNKMCNSYTQGVLLIP